MSWQVTAVIIATLGTVITGILKFVPKRSGNNPHGATDLAVLKSEVANLRHSHEKLCKTVQTLIDKLMDWMKER